ncbi:hypothetical protein ROT00_07380 [Agromyces mediolanus]|uniref:hypothetical protein n=1 Tax=Agromyces mediolanus TaxID=41986 RepID=UPI00383729CE
MTTTAARRGTRFRYEADMLPALRAAIPELAFGREYRAAVETYREVPAVHGIPDLAAIRFDEAALARRDQAGITPLSTDVEVRAVLALGQEALNLGELAERMRATRDYVRRAVLPLLEGENWVVRTDDGRIRRHPDALWAARRVVTVEAKLRDWTRAVAQARRQRLSADAAYIAVDHAATASMLAELDAIAANGIGVITVGADTGRCRVLVRPQRVLTRNQTMVGRMLIAERCLDMRARGESDGQIYPVFGWTAPIS